MSKTIIIKNDAQLPTIEWSELKQYELNNLKERKGKDIEKLKTAILKNGFKYPFYLWQKGKYVIDGSGRYLALQSLEEDGYTIPPIPYISLSPKNKIEAKQDTLGISSKYGEENSISVANFIIDMKDIDLSIFNLPGFVLDNTELVITPNKEIDISDIEVNEKGKSQVEHTCPKCNYVFKTTD